MQIICIGIMKTSKQIRRKTELMTKDEITILDTMFEVDKIMNELNGLGFDPLAKGARAEERDQVNEVKLKISNLYGQMDHERNLFVKMIENCRAGKDARALIDADFYITLRVRHFVARGQELNEQYKKLPNTSSGDDLLGFIRGRLGRGEWVPKWICRHWDRSEDPPFTWAKL